MNTMQIVRFISANNYLFKVDNGNTKARREMCEQLTTATFLKLEQCKTLRKSLHK